MKVSAPPVTISVDPGSPSIRASAGVRPRLSTTTLRGCLSRAAPDPSLAVSHGSSASTVLIPTITASDAARSR